MSNMGVQMFLEKITAHGQSGLSWYTITSLTAAPAPAVSMGDL